VTHMMNTGFRLRRWQGGTGAAGAEVVPTSVPLRDPDMYFDMHLLAVSEDAAELDESHSMAMGLRVPLCGRAARPAVTASYAGLCVSMLLVATCPSVALMAHELLPEASSGAGRRKAGSPQESRPSWLAFLFLSSRRVRTLAGPLAFRAATALFSLLVDKTFLCSRTRAGDCLAAEIAFKKQGAPASVSAARRRVSSHELTHLLTMVRTIGGGRTSIEHSCLLLYPAPLALSIHRERPFTSLESVLTSRCWLLDGEPGKGLSSA
jgi:hypothetical protein